MTDQQILSTKGWLIKGEKGFSLNTLGQLILNNEGMWFVNKNKEVIFFLQQKDIQEIIQNYTRIIITTTDSTIYTINFRWEPPTYGLSKLIRVGMQYQKWYNEYDESNARAWNQKLVELGYPIRKFEIVSLSSQRKLQRALLYLFPALLFLGIATFCALFSITSLFGSFLN